MDGGLDKHQLAGLDDRERGFSRPVEFERAGEGYRAILRYETLCVRSETQPTQDQALTLLVQSLQTQGYRQLKTQLSFHDGLYLGSRELWVEYSDPPQTAPQQSGFFDKIKNWFRGQSVDGEQS